MGQADLIWKYCGGARADEIDVYVDSDWAGDKDQRKSTSGGLVTMGDGDQELVANSTWA